MSIIFLVLANRNYVYLEDSGDEFSWCICSRLVKISARPIDISTNLSFTFGFGTFFKTFLLFFFSKPLSPLLLLLSVAQPRHFFSSIKLPPLIQLWWFYSGFQLSEWFQQSWYEISPLKSLDSNEESKIWQCNLINYKLRKCKNNNFTSSLKEIEGLFW